jgi:hypothetical protein
MADPENASIGVASQSTRIEEFDDSPELTFGSFGYWLDQGPDVESEQMYITPDLGWVDREMMFDSMVNPFLVDIPNDDFWVSPNPPTRLKTRDTLIFSYQGSYIKLPDYALALLGGDGKYFFRFEDGSIDWFELRLDAPPPEDPPGDFKRGKPWL